MSKPTIAEIEQGIGSEVDHFVYRVPKKNHDAIVQLSKEFGDIIRNHRVTHLVFQLNNTEAPMEGITNIAKIISLLKMRKFGWSNFYRDRKHKDEVGAKMRNDERMGTLMATVHGSRQSREPASSWGSSTASRSRLCISNG